MRFEIEFNRDLKTMKEILSKGQYIIYKARSKSLLNLLRGSYRKYDICDTDTGFKVSGDGSKEDCEEERDKFEDFMLGSDFKDSQIKNILNDRSLSLIRRKYKAFKTSAFKKATKNMNVLSVLNSNGIIVSWRLLNLPEIAI